MAFSTLAALFQLHAFTDGYRCGLSATELDAVEYVVCDRHDLSPFRIALAHDGRAIRDWLRDQVAPVQAVLGCPGVDLGDIGFSVAEAGGAGPDGAS